ncbi:MAG TPA: hypothetical protein VJ840_13225 [Gemmatimonadaceae bacterium]|nr:hypothetical protein [Gemmatimonadaceae bacterium]
MPTFFEAEHIDVKASGSIHVADEEDWTSVPPMNCLISRFFHRRALC